VRFGSINAEALNIISLVYGTLSLCGQMMTGNRPTAELKTPA